MRVFFVYIKLFDIRNPSKLFGLLYLQKEDHTTVDSIGIFACSPKSMLPFWKYTVRNGTEIKTAQKSSSLRSPRQGSSLPADDTPTTSAPLRAQLWRNASLKGEPFMPEGEQHLALINRWQTITVHL